MPYPRNLETAQSVERIISSTSNNTVIPATMALVAGRVHVGLSSSTLSHLADPATESIKISRRDLPWAMSQGLNGGTTVAGTMILADLVGIDLFVTGGIGGVHRGAPTSMDVSADLNELAKSRVGVVCAGAKSILDIGLTLEVLVSETVT